jgi:uncharacterized protein (TIGR02246 family)
MIQNSTVDPARIALDLWSRLTPRGTGPSMALLAATCTADVEQVNGFGVYSKGREALFAAAQQAVVKDKTVGLESTVASANLLAADVILAHIVSSAEIPDGPRAGQIQFRFTLVIVNQDEAWKIRSMSTTLVQPLPS